MSIQKVIVKIAEKIDSLKEDYIKWVREKSKILAGQAVSSTKKLLIHKQLIGLVNFRTNIIPFFNCSKNFPIDPNLVRSKNKLTCIKYKQIHSLSYYRIISWAAVFPPTVQTRSFLTRPYLLLSYQKYRIKEISSMA